MTRRPLLLALGLSLALAAIVGVTVRHELMSRRSTRGHSIDQEHVQRIPIGMRQAEVEAVLGGPPGDFTTRWMRFEDLRRAPGRRASGRWERWAGNHGQIQVCFDGEGKTNAVCFSRGAPVSFGWQSQTRNWLRRLWSWLGLPSPATPPSFGGPDPDP